VAGLIGARQVGKTTLARELHESWREGSTFFDLTDPRDLALQDLDLAALTVVYPGTEQYRLHERVKVVPLAKCLAEISFARDPSDTPRGSAHPPHRLPPPLPLGYPVADGGRRLVYGMTMYSANVYSIRGAAWYGHRST